MLKPVNVTPLGLNEDMRIAFPRRTREVEDANKRIIAGAKWIAQNCAPPVAAKANSQDVVGVR